MLNDQSVRLVNGHSVLLELAPDYVVKSGLVFGSSETSFVQGQDLKLNFAMADHLAHDKCRNRLQWRTL